MGLFGKIFKEKGAKPPKGFVEVTVKSIDSVGKDTVKVSFDIPSENETDFVFTPGQYLVIAPIINGKEVRRSYSICSAPSEDLAIAAKRVENGLVSNWLNDELKAGDMIYISKPEGSFTIPNDSKNIVLIAAGSGITPMISFMKSETEQSFKLFYGNRTEKDILFKNELDNLNIEKKYYLSREEVSGCVNSRINKESFTAVLKEDLSILQSDVFMLCGPEEMIFEISDLLKSFGVSENKVRFELFTTPTKEKSDKKASSDFKGKAELTVIVDSEKETFAISAKENILEKALMEGLDVPYSCKGGVCSSCKAKVLEGTVDMDINFSLTDKDVEEGYILTCQAKPTSDKIVVSYDEA
jgi:ring-1,2-phenylacetyl-CoA epoxidase subunit PaaE